MHWESNAKIPVCAVCFFGNDARKEVGKHHWEENCKESGDEVFEPKYRQGFVSMEKDCKWLPYQIIVK